MTKNFISALLMVACCLAVATPAAQGSPPSTPSSNSGNATDTGATIQSAPDGPMCEWSPHEVVQPALQCGRNDVGAANPGRFDCGKDSKCHDVCRFKECVEP